jgi:hypothetical protein
MWRAGVKAGLVGAIVAAVLAALTLVPCLGCIASIVGLFWYIGVGVLAAYWLTPPRTTGDGAGAGAVAGVVTALVGGLVSMVVNAIQFSLMGGQAAIMSQMPPDALNQLRDAGIDPGIFASVGGIVAISAGCCMIGLVLAAILGAIGGAVMAAARSDGTAPQVIEQ